MTSPTEVRRAGLDYLEAVTMLLNRIRTTHPTAGLYEAAELQWWWAQNPRTTDDLEQLFWFDDLGHPEAAVVVTQCCEPPPPHDQRASDHIDPEPRLQQTSPYRPDLDLVVYDDNEEVSGYGLFWHDPATAVGVVEPMRTENEHQQQGLDRHILTCGVDRLARAGAKRIKVCFDPDNAAAKPSTCT